MYIIPRPTMTTNLRPLAAGDEARLEAFLVRHADTSMFLRSNARAAGLDYRGEAYQGTYVAALDGDAIVAVAAHTWNGMIMVQAPTMALDDVVRGAVRASGRDVTGLSGPYAQVLAGRRALGLNDVPASMDAKERLFRLELDGLVVPGPLARGEVRCIRPRDEDRALITEWRVDYCVEALGDHETPALREICRRDIERVIARRSCFVLLDAASTVVAYTGFNAELPDCVQIGGVFTPKPLRRRGHAQAAVAGSLLVARDSGVTRSILFTSEDNVAATRAYLALGYEIVGDYGLVRFPRPVHVPGLDGTFAS